MECCGCDLESGGSVTNGVLCGQWSLLAAMDGSSVDGPVVGCASQQLLSATLTCMRSDQPTSCCGFGSWPSHYTPSSSMGRGGVRTARHLELGSSHCSWNSSYSLALRVHDTMDTSTR